MTTLRERQRRTDKFLDFPQKVEQDLVDALVGINTAQIRFLMQSYEDEDLKEALKTVEDKLEPVLAEVRKLQKQARDERTRANSLSELGQDLQDFLIKKADQMTLPQEDWATYQRKAKDGQELFDEYVDLLQGVAVRDAGFDTDLFRIADRLPSLWRRANGYSWQSMAIPCSQELLHQSAAHMLRVGFPEWTIFALPLLQHEFAHIFLRLTSLERLAVAASETNAGGNGAGHLAAVPAVGVVATVQDNQTATMCMADAAALCVTGPAYACAALFMRLDPADVQAVGDLTTCRAAAILKALECIVEKSPEDNPLPLIHLRLKTEWYNAVSAVGNIDAMRAAEQSEDIRKWVYEAWQSVTSEDLEGAPKLPQWAERWDAVYNWSVKLRHALGSQAEPQVIDIDSLTSTDSGPFALVLVLNAAWMVRVSAARNIHDPSPGESDVTDPADVEQVGQEAIRCCLQLVGFLGGGPAGPPTSSRRPTAVASNPLRPK